MYLDVAHIGNKNALSKFFGVEFHSKEWKLSNEKNFWKNSLILNL